MKHFISSLSVINANTPPCEDRVSSRKILSLLLILFLSIGNVWAEEVTFSGDDIRASFNYGNNYKEGTFTSDGFSIYCSSGYGNTAAQFRVAKSATLTISSTVGNITKVVITVTGTSYKLNDNNISWSSTTGTYSNAGGVQEITFTNSSANIARISEIAITYEPSSAGGGENSGEGEESETPGSQSTATLIVGENGGVTWTNGAKTANATVGDVVFTALGSGSNDSKYYDSDKSWRFYTANTSGVKITIPEGSKIVSVIIKWKTGQPNTPTNWSKSGTSSPTTFTPNSGINTNEVSFTRNSSANFLAQEITVNYETSSSGSGSEEPAPSVRLDPSSKDFGTVNVGENLSQEFTITTENTTATLSAEISNTTDYVISDIADNKITVTYQPQTAGTHEATLTIKAGEEASTTVALTGKAKTPLEPIAGGVIDILNQAWTGKTNSTYGDVAEKTAENTGHSNAKYVAQCAGDKSSIQLRSNNSNSGVVSTISGGVVKRIEVEWHADTDAARTLQIYGSNTAYTAATDLYGAAAGELLGELNKGEGETTLDFSEWTGDYKYIGFRSKSGAMYLTTVTITWLPTISKVTIDDQIENGSVSVSGAADLNSVAAGTELTLSHTPTTGYKLSAYDVYKTGDNTTKVTIDGNTFVMPEFDVTISATFELAKTLTSIEITSAATQTTFWQGETFNYTGLEVTAHFDGAADEVVTPTVTGSTATAGTQTVTVSYEEGSTTKTATYNITVKAIPNTKETAYTIADAFDIIDKLTTANGVFIKGIVSQVDSYNSTYQSITYWISADGTTTKQLQVYSGKGLESADFTAVTDVAKGAQVIVCGNLKKHNTTYEFDYNNYLAAYTAPTKAEPGIAYETTEYTANVNEAFTAPTLTNPNDLTVAYSTSDATLATVDATTGAVTILDKAGKVTITASFAGDDDYVAGSASYTINITDPSVSEATFVAGTDKSEELTITKNGVTVEFTGGTFSRDDNYRCYVGKSMTISYADGNITKIVIECTANDGAEYGPGQFTTETATYSYSGKVGTWTGEANSVTFTNIKQVRMTAITVYYKQDTRTPAGLAWNPATISLTVGDAFTAPTFSKPNSVTGITFASDNEALATVNNTGSISLVSGKTGTATITATYAGNETYKPAEVTCVITVSPKSEKVVILAEYNGQWYAMTGAYVSGKTNVLSAISVEYINGTLYNVAEADKASIEWQRSMNGNKAIFKNGDNYLTGGTSTNLTLETTEFEWDYNGVNYLCNDGKRTFLYCENTKTNVFGFKNYAISNAGSVKSNSDGTTESYSSTPVVTTPIYKTATFYTRSELTEGNYGTICLPYASDNFTGATFFEVAGKEGNKIVFDEVAALEAGKPYIFLAEATEIKVAQIGTAELTAQRHNSLQGTFTQINPATDNELVDNYMVVNNVIKKCGVNCGLQANRAYFVATELENLGTAPAPAPSVRRISMGVTGQNTATGVDQVQGDEVPTKMIINGQLFILRGEKTYDAQGKLVK